MDVIQQRWYRQPKFCHLAHGLNEGFCRLADIAICLIADTNNQDNIYSYKIPHVFGQIAILKI